MKEKKLYTAFFLFILTSILIGSCNNTSSDENIPPTNNDPEPITYKVTFNATWSLSTHPQDFPSGSHFSTLVGAVHNENVSFWETGEIASTGIESMAETGGTSRLLDEVSKSKSDQTTLSSLLGTKVFRSPGKDEFTFTINKDFPYVTLVSMIAPSPDWFVGVNSLLLYENDLWIKRREVMLFAYDAGSDSGTTYTSPNQDTNPKQRIFRIEEVPFKVNENLVPLGTFVFEQQ